MSNEAKRRKRLLAGVLAGALALSVTPILGFTGVAGADHIEVADPIGDGNVCEDAPETDPFTDVTDADPAVDEIRCMANTEPELTRGKTATTYEPNSPTLRGQMALFLQRIADLAEANETSEDAIQALPAGDGVTPFTDIGDWPAEHQAAIDRLEEAGITEGVTPTEFRPEADVSRRQMAKFIVRLQQYLAGEDFPPTPSEDYFDDDNGDSGEDELNILAEEGVFIGVASAAGTHNVQPGADITRRQMAFVVTRKLEVLFEAGLITRLYAEDDTNQAFTVTPAADETQEEGTQRQYTVSGITSDTVDIRLFECSEVTVGEGGIVSFQDDNPNNGLADEGTTTGASITVVNGAAGGSTDEVTPINGTVSFTVTSTDSVCVIPVVFDDANDNDALDLNADDEPTEAFGVGGATQFIPAEAADGDTLGGDVLAVGGRDYAVVADTLGSTTGDQSVFFRDGDEYAILNTSNSQCVTVTADEFFANLSVGDDLFVNQVPGFIGLFVPYDQDGPNEYCLNDTDPVGPTALTATPDAARPDTTVDLDWTASATTTVDSYKVYANDEACAATTVAELAVIGTTNAATTEFEATGLTPSTTYCFVVTAVDDGDESTVAVGTAADGDDNTAEESTAGPVDAPTITSAVLTTDMVTEGLATTGDVWTLTFNEEMDPATVAEATFSLTDVDGDTILVDCGVVAVAADTEATCVLGDGGTPATPNDTLTITLDENAQDRNAAGDGLIEYPLTITAITGLEDLDDGVTPDVAGSADKQIG